MIKPKISLLDACCERAKNLRETFFYMGETLEEGKKWQEIE
jgi:hypothetical protein